MHRSRAMLLTLFLLGAAAAGGAGTTATADEHPHTLSLQNTSPPEHTTIEHTIELRAPAITADTPVQVQFADVYADRISVTRVTTTDNATIEHTLVDGPDADGQTETVRLRPTGNTTSTQLTLTVELPHPAVESPTTYPITSHHDGQDQTAEYTVHPIGPTNRSGPTGTFDRRNGTGFIYDGATVFQGERDITFRGDLATQLTGVQGTTAPVPLAPPVPTDQSPGLYSNDGTNNTAQIRVQEPRITTFEVRNELGKDISGGVLPVAETTTLSVIAKSNFATAEQLTLTVRDESGLDVTNEVTTDPTRAEGAGGTVNWTLTIPNADAAAYTITVEGADDLTSGDAHRSTQIELTDDDPTISVERPIVSRGDTASIQYTNAPTGSHHLVTIDADDITNDVSLQTILNIFRNVNHVTEIGVITDSGDTVTTPSELPRESIDRVFAQVTVENADSTETLEIHTDTIDTDTLTINLHERESTLQQAATDPTVIDTVELIITDADVGLTAPDSYVVNSETTIEGRTSPGIETVALYVRAGTQYRLVDLDGENDNVDGQISVTDGSFERSEVVLARGDTTGNELLSYPGSYRLGVLTTDQFSGQPPQTLNRTAFQGRTSAHHRLQVTDTELNMTIHAPNREITTRDTDVTITGTAVGADAVGIVLVGQQDTMQYQRTETASNTSYSVDFDISEYPDGDVTVFVITPGRDGQLGDGTLTINGTTHPATLQTMDDYLADFNDRTAQQLQRLITTQTVADTGSDDVITADQFRIVDPRITIDTVTASETPPYTPGQELTVQGTINLDPTNRFIELDLQRDGQVVRDARVDTWTDEWSGTLETQNLPPGTYTIRAHVANSVDYRQIQLVAEQHTTTGTTATQRTANVSVAQAADTAAGSDTAAATSLTPEQTTHIHRRSIMRQMAHFIPIQLPYLLGLLVMLTAGYLHVRD